MPRRNKTPPHTIPPIVDCSTKRRYSSERKALETADYQMLLYPNIELAVYKCDRCGGWHLTSRPDGRHNRH